MTEKISILEDRTIIEISGEDSKKFLQGLITNDINQLSAKNLLFSAMLNAKGRFLYDLFIFEINNKIFLDCLTSRRDEIIKKLGFYKLRADVQIAKNDNILVTQDLTGSINPEENIKIFKDPRSPNLGNRIYILDKNLNKLPTQNSQNYHFARIKNKIAESEHDLTFEKSLILEFNFNEQNAVNYEKGCYIGQELTARTHHTGQIRKKLAHVTIEGQQEKIEKNLKITCEGKKLGIILSSVLFENNLHALILLKSEENEDLPKNLELNSQKILVIS